MSASCNLRSTVFYMGLVCNTESKKSDSIPGCKSINTWRTLGRDGTRGGAGLKRDTHGKRDSFGNVLFVPLARRDGAGTSALRGGHEPMTDGGRNGHANGSNIWIGCNVCKCLFEG